MGNTEIPDDFSVKIDQVKTNLKSWTLLDWVLFFIIIPAILFLIYALPQNIKDTYFIFKYRKSLETANLVFAAFFAYTFMSLVLGILGVRLEDFDHPELFKSRILFYFLCGLLKVMLALIIFGGLILGMFMNLGESTSNGIAHFGGFITGLIVFFV